MEHHSQCAKYKLVLDIVLSKAKHKLVVVCLAFTKVTILLVLTQKAASNDESFKDVVTEIEKHLHAIKELFP
jgi:aspartokinase/homoserine dehydrogenase 1